MLRLFAQGTDDDGVYLPEDPESAVVWILLLGVIVGLYLLVSRTRRRHEREFWERKREEEERQRRRPDLE